jgi:hypothetical protein
VLSRRGRGQTWVWALSQTRIQINITMPSAIKPTTAILSSLQVLIGCNRCFD